jgi:hypothetical protein
MKCDNFRKLIEPLKNSDQSTVLPEIREQWEAHLHSCDACLEIFEQQLATQAGDQFTERVLQATSEPVAEVDLLLQELSQQLQNIEPPENFLDSVMAQTASMQQSRQQSWQRWQRWKQVLMPLLMRPRFAQEIAFVGTLCWALVFGVPDDDFITTQDFQQWVDQITETLTL